jgi:predicted DCC family thiol-disulfide oxidoreductase YuxK
MPHPILLYDGVCGLCNRLVQFILRRDRNAIFRFAPLQSALAARVLAQHGASPNALDTVYVVVNPDPMSQDPTMHDPAETRANEYLLSRSDAVLFVLQRLGGRWRVAAILLQMVPRFLREATYNAIARRRYRIFGRSETCILPSPQDRSRFLDL